MKRKEPMKTPVRGTCKRTGQVYEYPSIAAVLDGGFDPGCVRDCVRKRAKTHAGMTWEAVGQLRTADPNGSPRLREAASLFLSGLGYEELGQKMGLTYNTARHYINQCRALGLVPTRSAAA